MPQRRVGEGRSPRTPKRAAATPRADPPATDPSADAAIGALAAVLLRLACEAILEEERRAEARE